MELCQYVLKFIPQDMCKTNRSMLSETIEKLRKPKPWKHPHPITVEQLKQTREEFWDTAPHYGGQRGACLMVATFTFSYLLIVLTLS